MNWLRVSGLCGASAVALGAIGAHAIINKSEHMKDTWKTGSYYHLVHSVVLLIAATNLHGRKKSIVCSLFLSGVIIFCGSLYTVVLMDQRRPYSYPAPVGGLLLIGGWLAIGLL
uniref:DUF423 domain-containing protein n=1 Tax=Chromulina nebulosa TaxID=96789 RepID=A0A7S0XFG7_9STRA|mmetsp:Transcript_2796/g.2456  ORF Transcript_2796/g.2456 Transcript_2796/m.2456 type:complete len:114 (+) Transcript_2796:53-394(+)